MPRARYTKEDSPGTVLTDSYLSSVGSTVVGGVSGENVLSWRYGSLARRACSMWASRQTVLLHQAKLAGTGDRFGAPLDLELAKDFQVVPFHRTQGEEQPLAHLTIREALGYEVEYL